MITTPPPSQFPVDGCTIRTQCQLSGELVGNPLTFANTYNLELREIKPGFKRAKGRNFPYLIFYVGDYGGIRCYASADAADGRWYIRSIRFNPGKVIYGHNGRILNAVEFGVALSVMVDLLIPFLKDPEDATKLVPGLPGSEAYWQSLEIPFHTSGTLLPAFTNMRHPKIKTPAQRYEGESIRLGKPTSSLMLNCYRKDVEMSGKLGEDEPLQFAGRGNPEEGILRVEVTLKRERLIEHLGGGRHTTVVDGVSRLTSFTSNTLRSAHRAIVSTLQGSFATMRREEPDNDKLGRFMALVSFHSGTPIDFWLEQYQHRFRPSKAFIGRHRASAINEASRISTVSFVDIFKDEFYDTQSSLILPRNERFAKHRRDNTPILPAIAEAYGIALSDNGERRFVPHTTLDV